jgi:hypothetical protein
MVKSGLVILNAKIIKLSHSEIPNNNIKMKYGKNFWIRSVIVILFTFLFFSAILKKSLNINNFSSSEITKNRERLSQAEDVVSSQSVHGHNFETNRDVSYLIDLLTISNDISQLEERFKSNPEEVIDALMIKAVENLDSKCSDLLGKLILENYGFQEGADYIDRELKGHVREWTRIGFGAALLVSDRAAFQEYLSGMNLCNARDNLVAMAVVEIGKTDAMGAYQMWEKERDDVGAGTSPAKDMMVSMMVQNLANQSDPAELERLIFSEGFFESGSSEVEQVSLMLSQSSPSLALKWAVDRQAVKEVRDHIIVDLFRNSYDTQEGGDKLIAHLAGASINESDAITSISESINRSTLGDSEGPSFDGLVDQFGWIVNKMPDSEQNRKLQERLGSALASQYPTKALEFAITVPAGRGRDAYINGAVSKISNSEPEQIYAIINQIADDEVRQDVLNKLEK